jgi:hypothetical protein
LQDSFGPTHTCNNASVSLENTDTNLGYALKQTKNFLFVTGTFYHDSDVVQHKCKIKTKHGV